MTKITFEMSEEAAKRLLEKFEQNPDEFKRYFARGGFEIVSLTAQFQSTKQHRCVACGSFWNDEPTVQICGDSNCGGVCVPVK